MSAVLDNPGAGTPSAVAPAAPASPGQRAWVRFKRNRIGYVSLWLFGGLLLLATFAELISNDKPLAARINGQWYMPVFSNPSERMLGGDFDTETDWKDPFVSELLRKSGNTAFFTLNPHSADSLDYFDPTLPPGAPSARNYLGTDSKGRDLLARLIYGFRISVWFALALTAVGTAIGIFMGALQGYFGGKVDLFGQRIIEIWNALPELYLLIIFSAVFDPSVGLLLLLLSLFGWMGLSDYVRAEFLRNRQLDYVKSARALGLGHWQIMWRHVLPNSMTPVVTFLPFRMSGAILALTSLDFLGLGVPPGTPSLGELLAQGKNNIDAWWISMSTFVVLVVTLLLLTFMGDALRDALDPRKVDA
jgi:microcin C transport system permease protein